MSAKAVEIKLIPAINGSLSAFILTIEPDCFQNLDQMIFRLLKFVSGYHTNEVQIVSVRFISQQNLARSLRKEQGGKNWEGYTNQNL